MLQLKRLSQLAAERLPAGDAEVTATGLELEQRADARIAELRRVRTDLARTDGRLAWALDGLDRAVRTQSREHLDDPEFCVKEKRWLVRYLHRFNDAAGAYDLQVQRLAPFIHRAVATRGSARVLEVACGAGESAVALARWARRHGIPVEIVATDIAEGFDEAASTAQREDLAVQFQVLDALRLDGSPLGAVDVVLCANSLHHFTPGQLARLFRGASRVAREGLVAFDGRRGLTTLGLIPLGGLLSRRRWVLHDAVVSARRFYSEPELLEIARLACPSAARMHPAGPLWSVLSLDFASRE